MAKDTKTNTGSTTGASSAESAVLTDGLKRMAKLKPDQWPLKTVAGENFLTVPEWFVIDAVNLANSILRPNV